MEENFYSKIITTITVVIDLISECFNRRETLNLQKIEKERCKEETRSVILHHIVPFNNIYINSLLERNMRGERIREVQYFANQWHLGKYQNRNVVSC